MKRGRKLAKGVALLFCGGSLSSGCSLLFRAEADQCRVTADCEDRGTAFQGTVCDAGSCVVASSGDGGAGGEGGSAPAIQCTTNGECIDANFGSPYICKAGKCVSLTLAGECPLVLGAGQDNENLRQPEPIIFGAYSYVDPTAPRQSVPTLNYELAIDEVNEKTRGGLQGGANGSLRPFVAVVCSATNSPDLDASSKHLIDHLEVPGIISSLFTKDLLSTFTEKGRAKNVFFLSPLEADSTLTLLDDNGLLWHMLASGLDLAPAYKPLLTDTETSVRSSRGIAPGDPIRVALIDAKTPFLSDIAEYVVESAKFNGVTMLENETAGQFLRVRIDSQIEVTSPDTSLALLALQDFQPHIVIGIASGEFVQLMADLELSWELAWGERPFYLLSPYVFGRSDLASPQLADLRSRMLGVNFASSNDTALYDAYLSRLKSTYQVDLNLDGSENFYDAAYFMMYSFAAAGTPPVLTGNELAIGMTRLVNGKTTFSVGPSDVNDGIGYLRGSSDSTLSLIGTMGPPTFNTATGARKGVPSVYCIDGTGKYVQNAMTFDAATETLAGTPSCVPGFPN